MANKGQSHHEKKLMKYYDEITLLEALFFFCWLKATLLFLAFFSSIISFIAGLDNGHRKKANKGQNREGPHAAGE